MTEQVFINIVAIIIGFCAAIFFCVGNVINTPTNIIRQSTPYWDFSEPVARAAAAQRAQYVTGALLLVISFSLQVVATQVSSTIPVTLPQYVHTLPHLVLVVFFLSFVLASSALFSEIVRRRTIKKIKEHIKKLESF